MTNQPTPVILSDEQVAEIEARANAATEGPWTLYTGGAITAGQERHCVAKVEFPHFPESMVDGRFMAHARTDIPALCQTVRGLRASETYWQAEALLNHFCSEHAKNTRQMGHYCTICAKPFVMTVPQGERPPKYKDLIAENTALRDRLAQVEKERDDLHDEAERLRELVRHMQFPRGG